MTPPQPSDEVDDADNGATTEVGTTELLRAAWEGASDAMALSDSQGIVIAANPAYYRLYGLTPGQVIGQSFAVIFPAEARPSAVEQYLQVFNNPDQPSVFEAEVQRGDGTRQVVESRTSFVTRDGRRVAMLSVIRDVTEHRRAEFQTETTLEGLRRGDARFRRYFELGVIGLAVTSPDKGFIEVNDQFCHVLGYERGELLQTSWAALTHPEDLDADIARFNRVLAREIDGYSMDKRWIRKDGRVIHSTISVKCLRRTDGSVDHFVSLLQDITRRKQAEDFSRAINDINQIIHSSLDADEILQDAVTAAARALGADTAAISLRQGRRWYFRHAYGFPEDIVGAQMDDEQEPHALLAMQTKKPVAISDALNDERVNRDHMRAWGIRSVLVVPLLLKNDAMGVIFFNYQKAILEFEDVHVDFATKLAASISLALENARLYRNLEEEIAERKRAEALLERQAGLLEQTHDAIVVWRLEDGIIYWNRACEELYGWSREEALGKVTHNLLQTEHPISLAEMKTALEREGRWDGEVTHVTRSGRRVIVESRCVLVRQGSERLVMETNRDVTKRKQAEEVLRQTLARTHELYEISQRIGAVDTPQDMLKWLLTSQQLQHTSSASISAFDQPWQNDGVPKTIEVLAYWNPAVGTSDLIGRHFPTEAAWIAKVQSRNGPVLVDNLVTDPDLSEGLRRHLQSLGVHRAAVFPLVAHNEWYGLMSFNFPRAGEIDGEAIRHIQGLVNQAAAAIYNIRLLEAEAAARREAEHQNEQRLRFMGMISHELRTPLTSIKGFASTLLATDVEWDKDSAAEFLVIIDQEADKLADMIDQILDLSRIESGALRVEPRSQPLDEIVSAALIHLAETNFAHTLATNIPAGLPPVYADGQRIEQVLTNLVGNAAKYSPSGTRIDISAQLDGAFVRVSVHDEGPGIPPQDRPHVFEAFRRGSDGQTRQTKGAGLGLAICKGIIEAHGGSIWIEDHDGSGAWISFTLPVTA